MPETKHNKTIPPKSLPQATEGFSFYYVYENQLEEYREICEERLEHFKRKGIDSKLSAREMFNVLLSGENIVLCIIRHNSDIVGMLYVREENIVLTGKRGLNVLLADVDRIDGFLEALNKEVDEIAETNNYDFVNFYFSRKGWLKLMVKYPDMGFDVKMFIGEKVYG